MKVIVCTLEDSAISEHYVGVIEGSVDKKTRRKLARAMQADLSEDTPEMGYPGDYRILFFREVETSKYANEALGTMPNIDDNYKEE